MEGVVTARADWSGRSVFLTGHTGFKGAWLALWLQQRRAEVYGLALDPPTNPALYHVADAASGMAADVRADLSDANAVTAAMTRAAPQVVFHLAAQPLVRESYRDPLGTFMTNVQGTAHVLEAARHCPSVRAIVVVTTDKVYRNEEWPHPYREGDHLGGADPYSASKAAAEIVAASYRESFYGKGMHRARLATARAGNVIGGGDWAAERLVPEALRASDADAPLSLRFPRAVRPWQHVLEPLSGYIRLAETLLGDDGAEYATAWNFGPDSRDDATVGEVAERATTLAGNRHGVQVPPRNDAFHEAGLLRLDSSRARARLGWAPRWDLETALAKTVDWHRAWRHGADMKSVTLSQIAAYEDK